MHNIPHAFGLRHLRAFVAACDERHVGRAAARLNLTQPAVSKILTELEAIIGQRLLERGRLGTRPTARGEAFLLQARKALDAVSAAGARVVDDDLPQPGVRLGVLPTVAPAVVPGLVALFGARHPGVGFVVMTHTNAELLALLRQGAIDVAVGRMSDPGATAGLLFELLYLEGLSIGVRPGHPLLALPSVAPEHLPGYRLVVCTAGTVPHRNTEALFGAHHLRLPANCIETLDAAVAAAIVRQSDAVWVAPTATIRSAPALECRAVSGSGATSLEAVGLFRRIDAVASPETDSVVACIREVAGQISPS